MAFLFNFGGFRQKAWRRKKDDCELENLSDFAFFPEQFFFKLWKILSGKNPDPHGQLDDQCDKPNGLFTEFSDTVDFSEVRAGSYLDGTQYNAGSGDDRVVLANTAQEQSESGYVQGSAFFAEAGDDTVTGQSLDDLIYGGDGNDHLFAGFGADSLFGGSGDDHLTVSGLGDGDLFDGGAGYDELTVFLENSLENRFVVQSATIEVNSETAKTFSIDKIVVSGGEKNDVIVGRGEANTFYGLNGDDRLFAGSGADSLYGGEGRDLIFFDDVNNDFADAGSGKDVLILRFGPSVNVDLATGHASAVDGSGSALFINFEDADIYGDGGALVSGTSASNTLVVRGEGNTISALDGEDAVSIFDGGNFLDGGEGTRDFLRINSSKQIYVDFSSNEYSIESSVGTVENFEWLKTYHSDDSIIGSQKDEYFWIGTGRDTINAGDGNDSVVVEDGGDDLFGGQGNNDWLRVESSNDCVINLQNANLSFEDENFSIFQEFENFVAGSGNDHLIGSSQEDVMFGGDGNDTLDTGGTSASGEVDKFYGGAGDDLLRFHQGQAILEGGSGNDTFIFSFSTPQSSSIKILDFNRQEDNLNLTDLEISLEDFLGSLEQNGASTFSNLGDLTIEFHNLSKTEFEQDHDSFLLL